MIKGLIILDKDGNILHSTDFVGSRERKQIFSLIINTLTSLFTETFDKKPFYLKLVNEHVYIGDSENVMCVIISDSENDRLREIAKQIANIINGGIKAKLENNKLELSHELVFTSVIDSFLLEFIMEDITNTISKLPKNLKTIKTTIKMEQKKNIMSNKARKMFLSVMESDLESVLNDILDGKFKTAFNSLDTVMSGSYKNFIKPLQAKVGILLNMFSVNSPAPPLSDLENIIEAIEDPLFKKILWLDYSRLISIGNQKQLSEILESNRELIEATLKEGNTSALIWAVLLSPAKKQWILDHALRIFENRSNLFYCVNLAEKFGFEVDWISEKNEIDVLSKLGEILMYITGEKCEKNTAKAAVLSVYIRAVVNLLGSEKVSKTTLRSILRKAVVLFDKLKGDVLSRENVFLSYILELLFHVYGVLYPIGLELNLDLPELNINYLKNEIENLVNSNNANRGERISFVKYLPGLISSLIKAYVDNGDYPEDLSLLLASLSKNLNKVLLEQDREAFYLAVMGILDGLGSIAVNISDEEKRRALLLHIYKLMVFIDRSLSIGDSPFRLYYLLKAVKLGLTYEGKEVIRETIGEIGDLGVHENSMIGEILTSMF